MDIQQVFNACSPIGLDHLHPASLAIMYEWSKGVVDTQEFIRWFSMPMSDYLPIARCMIRMLAMTRGA